MTLINQLLRRRGLGCRLDEPDARDERFAAMALPSIGLPAVVSMRQHVVEVLDQGASNSCVAQSVCQAYRLARAIRGEQSPPLPSRLFCYWHARADHGDQRADQGTYCRSAIKALVRFGAPPESAWPFSTAGRVVNRRPSWAADRAGHDSRGPESYYRIFETGQARSDAVRAALAGGYPVIFGTAVSRSFTESAGAPVIDRPGAGDPIVGRHAMVIIGYSHQAGTFEIVNSWSSGWRDGGFACLTRSYLEWAETSDLQVMRLAA